MYMTRRHALRLLGLSERSSPVDVRVARRSMAFKHHPDICNNVLGATQKMAAMNAAADFLLSILERERSDASPQDISLPAKAAFASKGLSYEGTAADPRSAMAKTTVERMLGVPALRNAGNSAPIFGQNDVVNRNSTPSKSVAESYRRTIVQIGETAGGSSVDMKILAFPTGHI
ncbi:hypothetical protein L0664_02180 [Octadecabacter sp. G9-8]|uniref:J domain-containing protein n=1 Tax=Octadecabacter dasysiphoniae TaxID=2909341 RepID=A0ABS9CTW2_9RHOB|nr:hypothetical protein [Octadecabacter dasysiphoniae]MCF2869865.1 hypothetical protein [Octadecabacter dasysiphoniae]